MKPAIAQPLRPIIFLNPAVITDPVGVVLVIKSEPAPAVGLVGGEGSHTNSAAGLNRIVSALDAVIVVTDNTGPFDARDSLLSRGLAAGMHFHADWLTDQTMTADRGAAIAKWRAQHPSAGRCIVIDRPGVEASKAVIVTVREGQALSVEAAASVVAAFKGAA
ncbi:hypothetical protein [Sphingomonas sp. BE137]|uniref:hypothetical protein n=1 Tax=Sphingomonas sp. BE137 TaxID=2817844 RepID=UPI001AE1CBE8|nr:hypothetical protein [Sphingomonas sp. BE137]MDR6850352.1 hypothetical protein [Sphingomonas sp. BE137]